MSASAAESVAYFPPGPTVIAPEGGELRAATERGKMCNTNVTMRLKSIVFNDSTITRKLGLLCALEFQLEGKTSFRGCENRFPTARKGEFEGRAYEHNGST